MVRHELQNWQVCLIVMYEHYLKTGKAQMRVGEILNEIRRHDPNWANTRGSRTPALTIMRDMVNEDCGCPRIFRCCRSGDNSYEIHDTKAADAVYEGLKVAHPLWHFMRFSTYSVQELSEFGSAFAVHFANLKLPETSDRKAAVLPWFCKAMAPGLRCYGRPAEREFPEFLTVDQCHVTFRMPVPGDKAGCKRWNQPLTGPCEVRLALTCECGKYYSPGETRAMVLDDAWKVAVIRATAKVVIFPTHQGEKRQESYRREIVDSLRALRMQSRDDAPWLWIDLPWITSEHDFPRNVVFDILSDPPLPPPPQSAAPSPEGGDGV